MHKMHWQAGKEPVCQCRRYQRCGFDPWAGNILRHRKRQATPVFLPGKFRGQRSLTGYSPRGCKKSDRTKHEPTLSFFFPFFFFKEVWLFYLFIFLNFLYHSGFCHTLKWNSHGFTCVPHPDPPSHLPLHPIPLGLPSAPGLSACFMYPTWAGDMFHPR